MRARVAALAHNVLVSLRTILELVNAKIDGLQTHAPALAALILTGGVLSENGRTLVGDEALEVRNPPQHLHISAY